MPDGYEGEYYSPKGPKMLLIAVAVIVAFMLLLGCQTAPQEPCASLDCIKREQARKAYRECLAANPDQKRPGMVTTYYGPGMLSWQQRCASIHR